MIVYVTTLNVKTGRNINVKYPEAIFFVRAEGIIWALRSILLLDDI